MSSEPILRVEYLEVTYGAAQALHGVSLRVAPAEVVVMLGRNGAGKSTTLKAISGVLPIDAARITGGRVLLDGRPIHNRPPHAVARRGLSLIPERDKVFRSLTVEENLQLVPVKRRDYTEMTTFVRDLFPSLAKRWKSRAGYLSGGEVQMLAIAKSLLLRPRLLIPDEISLGIAPHLVEKLMESLRRINKDTGMAILMAEQNAAAALSIADYAYLMDDGVVALDGPASAVAQDSTLRELYLGLGADSGRYLDIKRARRHR